jgi:hypothetical protein
MEKFQTQAINHCVIVKITTCDNKDYWYADLVGQHLVAFGYDNVQEEIYCCHKSNKHNEVSTLPIEDCVIVKGDINNLYEMSW